MTRFTKAEEQKIIFEYQSGVVVEDLGLKLSCSPQTICNILARNNIDRRKYGEHLTCKTNTPLTSEHRQIIEGLLLGDGSVLVNPNGVTPHLNLVTTQKMMAEHVVGLFPFDMNFCHIPACRRLIKGKEYNCKDSYQVYSKSDLSLHQFRNNWYPNSKKVIPANLSLSPISVKYWFFGDGSCDTSHSTHNRKKYPTTRIAFYTNGFTFDDCEILRIKLKNQDLNFNIGKNRNLPILTSSKTKTISDFFDYIGDCDVSCYNYKWKKA